MFENNYSKKGYCMRCGKYKPLNIWNVCRRCDLANKLKKKSKFLRLPYKK